MKSDKYSAKKSFGPHLWEITAVKDIAGILLIFGFILIAFRLKTVIAPVFFGLFLAYLFNPAVSFAEKKLKIARPATISALIGALLAGAIFAIVWFSPVVADQAKILVKKTPQYLDYLYAKHNIHSGLIKTKIIEVLNRVKQHPLPVITAFFNVISTTTHILLWLFLVPVFFFFFSWKFEKMLSACAQYLPESRRGRITGIVLRIDKVFGDFFRGRLIVATVVGFMLSFGWWFLNVPYWFLLGMATGILNIVPYLSVIGWIITLIFAYLDYTAGQGLSGLMWLNVFVWPTAVFAIVNFIDNWFLTPWVQSKSLNLSVVSIIVAVLAGGILGGFAGMLFAIPIAGCIKILFEELILPRIKKV